MRPATSILQLAVCLSSLTPLTAAWPGWLPEADVLVVRADSTADATETPSPTTKAKASEASATQSGKQPITTANLNTAKPETGTDSATGKSKATGTNSDDDSESTHTTFAANDPQGGVSITEPATTLMATPLFKIGDYVTLGWNYTSLQGTPTAIDVLVSCSSASETWTLTGNMSFATAVTYVWDTKEQANDVEAPLGTDMYTLIIKDSDATMTQRAEPGYLGVYSGLKFGLYKPKDYTPLPDWHCTGCNAGSSNIDRHAVGMALTMSILTICSFTWFVTGLVLH